jgi:L-Ala-D/L-Glu epimerase
MPLVKYYPFNLEFQYPFTIAKGTKTHQPTLVVSLSLGPNTGYGEAPAITNYNVTVESMIGELEKKKFVIDKYALTDPERFWHFLEHLLPGQYFLIAALDIAAWDLFGKMRRKPVYQLLNLERKNLPLTDYTIGIDTTENMVAKLKAHPWPIYKIKIREEKDIDLIIALRKETTSPFRVDANEALSFDSALRLIPEFKKLGVNLVEQPLPKDSWEEMEELKAKSSIPLFADESCVTEKDVVRCIKSFDGINIKLTKCGGITPALRMIKQARENGIKVMMGSMNESTIGSGAIAQLMPLLDEVDVDGPLLLKEDVADGLIYNSGEVSITEAPGMGTSFKGLYSK